MARLRDLIASRNSTFREGFVGRSLPAVTLQAIEHALPRALTDNFLEVALSTPVPANRCVRVRIEELTESGLRGAAAA